MAVSLPQGYRKKRGCKAEKATVILKAKREIWRGVRR